MEDQGRPRASHFGPSAESTLVTLAVLAVVVVLLSALVFIPRGSTAANAASTRSATSTKNGGRTSNGKTTAGGNGAGGAAGDVVGNYTSGDGSDGGDGSTVGADDGSGSTDGSGDTVTNGDGTDLALGADGSTDGGTAKAPGTTGGTTSGGSGGATAGGGVAPGAPDASCNVAGNGGSTDTGVTGGGIVLGAVTVDTGAGASFLQPEDVAMQAVVRKINSSGGICGRQVTLKLKDSGWDAQKGFSYIQNLVEGDKVFALVVNPDSEGLALASSSGYLKQKGVPVIGTDGLLYSQYQDPMIWPIAASTVTAMHAIALSQSASGKQNFSLVYEKTYRFGREGANAYNRMVKLKTGSDIPGYSDPNSNAQCSKRFCGIVANSNGYGSEANSINTACQAAPACDAGAVLLEPTTATTWFKSGGKFGGEGSPVGGAGAAPQPLFARSFADACQQTCHQMRLWTGFLPPIEQFASAPGVQQYVNDMKAYSSSVDVNNQFAEGAYLGMRLAMDVIKQASGSGSGLTRSSVVQLLDATSKYDIGLTVQPLSWSPGNHFAETAVHAFDESYPAGFGGWQYVQGSQTSDPDPTHI